MSSATKSRSVCRICLEPNLENSHGIFDLEKDMSISDHITSIARVVIDRSDNLPHIICDKCLNDLKIAIEFKYRCELSDEFLRKPVIEYELQDKRYIKLINEEVCKIEYTDDDSNGEDCCLPDYQDENTDGIYPVQTTKRAKLVCNSCGMQFARKKRLAAHIKNNCFDKYLCKICKRLFVKELSLHKHLKTYHKGATNNYEDDEFMFVQGMGKSRIFCCRQCKYKTHRHIHMKCHVRTHTGARPFKCEVCPKAYSQLGPLLQHKLHHIESPATFPCDKCGKLFRSKRYLYNHQRKVHTDKKFECNLCGKQVKSRDSLTQHMARHNGEKNFSCEQCAAAFYSHSELCNHKNTHKEKVKTFQCTLCSYSASRKSTIDNHIKRHTAEKPFSCSQCGKMFEKIEVRNMHVKRHLPSMKFKCPICPTMCCDLRTLRKHIIRKHDVMCTVKMLQITCAENNIKNELRLNVGAGVNQQIATTVDLKKIENH